MVILSKLDPGLKSLLISSHSLAIFTSNVCDRSLENIKVFSMSFIYLNKLNFF